MEETKAGDQLYLNGHAGRCPGHVNGQFSSWDYRPHCGDSPLSTIEWGPTLSWGRVIQWTCCLQLRRWSHCQSRKAIGEATYHYHCRKSSNTVNLWCNLQMRFRVQGKWNVRVGWCHPWMQLQRYTSPLHQTVRRRNVTFRGEHLARPSTNRESNDQVQQRTPSSSITAGADMSPGVRDRRHRRC